MIKKLLFITVMCVVTIMSQAQAMGQWQLYPSKSSSAGIVYEGTGDCVYYVSGSNIFSYDKSTTEIETYNSGNYLSDTDVKNIYYNYQKGYLLILYNNSNIDLLFDDKTVVNIPDLKNTIMTQSKAVNDVFFDNNKVYMATDFGLLILNDEKYEVYESYLYNKAISKITVTGSNIFILINNNLYVADKVSGLYNFDASWRAVNVATTPQKVNYLYALNDKNVLFAYDSKAYVYNVESDTFYNQTASFYNAKFINESKNGLLFSYNDKVQFVSRDLTSSNALNVIKTITLSDAKVKNGYYSSYNNDESIWACSSAGISHFGVTDGAITWLVEPSTYNTASVTLAQSLLVHNNKLYVKNLGPYNYSSDMSSATTISVLDMNTHEWSDMQLDKVSRGGKNTSKGVLRSSMNMVFDKDSNEVFYVGSWFDGLHKFNGSKYVGNYNASNSYISNGYSKNSHFAGMDTDGNLWALLPYNNIGTSNVLLACLPADKKILDPLAVKKTDWVVYDSGFNSEFFCNIMVAKKSPYVFVVNCKQVGSTRLFILNRETGDSRVFTTFTDQDGNPFGNGVHYFYTAEEDLNGNVWVGTSSGPIILSNLSNIMSSDYRCTRIKVPRNDGTNYADYLLEDESINTIVVDGANRKWLGTSTSGVYLVSENGTEILENHSTENSILPSNMVYDMAMDNVTGELFVGTDKGVVSYRSDVSQSAPNYDSVIAFPNPVRPDYTGWITVQGLMDNSLVKITDVAGNLFSQGYSNGGTYTWDGRTATGERVKTGVYLVYVSQSGGTSGVVTKIMVVN